ncbi:hypothetical protein PspTeo4_30400 [Pseudomonas sp. Teo4]|nr:hypothetical protein [Pseudomonas sp. Teo4]
MGRSHMDRGTLWITAIPVGAGLPAIRPVLATQDDTSLIQGLPSPCDYGQGLMDDAYMGIKRSI